MATPSPYDYQAILSNVADVYVDVEWTIPSYGRCRMLESDRNSFIENSPYYDERRKILQKYLKQYPWHGDGKHNLTKAKLSKLYPKTAMESKMMAQYKAYSAQQAMRGKSDFSKTVNANSTVTMDLSDAAISDVREDGTLTSTDVITKGSVMVSAGMPATPAMEIAATSASKQTQPTILSGKASAKSTLQKKSGEISSAMNEGYGEMATNISSIKNIDMTAFAAAAAVRMSDIWAQATGAVGNAFQMLTDRITAIQEGITELIDDAIENMSTLVSEASTGINPGGAAQLVQDAQEAADNAGWSGTKYMCLEKNGSCKCENLTQAQYDAKIADGYGPCSP